MGPDPALQSKPHRHPEAEEGQLGFFHHSLLTHLPKHHGHSLGAAAPALPMGLRLCQHPPQHSTHGASAQGCASQENCLSAAVRNQFPCLEICKGRQCRQPTDPPSPSTEGLACYFKTWFPAPWDAYVTLLKRDRVWRLSHSSMQTDKELFPPQFSP